MAVAARQMPELASRVGPRTDALTTIVVPTQGRYRLFPLCRALATQTLALDAPVIIVDERCDGAERDLSMGLQVRVLASAGGGRARARNLAWRHARTPWVSFLDDVVLPDPDWFERLLFDLEQLQSGGAVGSQGRIRGAARSAQTPDDTVDVSYRREALASAGGFDERFARAWVADADLALRLGGDGRHRPNVLPTGTRSVTVPPRTSDGWVGAPHPVGRSDEALMSALHGKDWGTRTRAGSSPGSPERAGRWPRLRSTVGHRHPQPWRGLPDLVLLDQDRTLLPAPPDDAAPQMIRRVALDRAALDALRAEGVRLGVLTRHRPVRGTPTADEVNARVEELLGPFEGVWCCLPGSDGDGDDGNSAPGLVKSACADLGVDPSRCVVIGGRGAHVEAVTSGARAVLVSTDAPDVARPERVGAAAPAVAADLAAAVRLIVQGRW